MPPARLHEHLARNRRRYERLLLSRMGSTITREDAEDFVSEALIKVQRKAAENPPERGKEEAWFTSIVINQAVDFVRVRDGRRRNGSKPRPGVTSLSGAEVDSAALAGDTSDGLPELDALAQEAEREQSQAAVARAMTKLSPQERELIELSLSAPEATRKELAAMAGLTLGQFRWRYPPAWRHFVEVFAQDAPKARCKHIRQLVGEVRAGSAPTGAADEIDAHTLDCPNCRVFARDLYSAVELLPFVPVVGIVERWSARIGGWWERSGPEASAGAGGAAGGAAGGLLTGGAAGALKALAVMCSATAMTAGVCVGVVVVLDDDPVDRAPPRTTEARRQAAPRPTSTSAPTATATPRPTSTPRKVTTRPAATTSRSTDTSGRSQIPASAPQGASEFKPSAPSADNDPAPAPATGGGEFGP